MSILAAMKFTQGAVSKKDFVPALSHFRIRSGRITGYNGSLVLSAPIALDVDCCPKADAFVKAVQACEETAQLHLTATGRLAIRSGKFRAHVDCIADAELPEVVPEGLPVAIDGELLPALALLYDFTSVDASRPWAAGVLLDGQSMFASNNVVLIQRWLGYHFPYRVNLPRDAIKEMIRIGEEPVAMQLTDMSATFYYPGERWLRTQLNSLEWPDAVSLLGQLTMDCPPVPEGMFEALELLEPFVDTLNRVYMNGDVVGTALEEGASVNVPGAPFTGCYNLKMLRLLKGVATHVGFDCYPHPVPFYGAKLRGAVAGIRI